eukprot:1142216-Pelagomonas_calceolata.AAC.2
MNVFCVAGRDQQAEQSNQNLAEDQSPICRAITTSHTRESYICPVLSSQRLKPFDHQPAHTVDPYGDSITQQALPSFPQLRYGVDFLPVRFEFPAPTYTCKLIPAHMNFRQGRVWRERHSNTEHLGMCAAGDDQAGDDQAGDKEADDTKAGANEADGNKAHGYEAGDG